MDVLELPRPVINFLRTMAKEGCRYVLSWDIFGGTDAVTLTLTWKLNDDQSELLKSPPSQQLYDNLHIQQNNILSSPRRSRRDDNNSKLNQIRLPRGKSLEDTNNIKTIKQNSSNISSLERSSIIHRKQKESDPIYANLSNTKYPTTTNPSTIFSSNNPPLSINHPSPRSTKKQCETPILRKTIFNNNNNNSSPNTRRINRNTKKNNNDYDDDDDDDTLDPWVKRFDSSLEPVEKFEDDIDRTDLTSGKVKFKRTPDYF